MKRNIIFGLIFSLLILGTSVSAESTGKDKCPADEYSLGESIGSASTWGNLRNNEGSLRYETQKLLDANLTRIDSSTSLVMSSTPKAYLTSYSNHAYCADLEVKTKSEPLKYTMSFDSPEDLNSWISDFSQGKGEEGSDLYKKCDKDCSPQYKYIISNDKNKPLKVIAQVICGHARDKSNNEYQLALKCVRE
jgi:hypothetical protein